MRTFVLVFALVSMTCSPVVVFAAGGDVTARIADESVSTVLELYGMYVGGKVTASDEVKAMKARVSVKIERKPKEEALKQLDQALAEQAGVEVFREADGSYSARRLVAKK